MQITLSKTVVSLRKPQASDGAGIWQLVRETGVLDLNSPYAYFLLGEHFAETCILAEHNHKIVGLVSAYLPPGAADSLFVWQVGIAASMRQQGLALKMLLALLQRESCRNITSIQTTITPSNKPSRALFNALAQAVEGGLIEQPDYFKAAWFPQGVHEPESLFTIQPIQLKPSA
jgi:L-2,4-diaminobutyric acid acetyltransferase